MFIELVDALRCLEPHEETWLVASVTRMDARHIVDGILGCPICRREYPIRDGIAWFAFDPATGLLPPTGVTVGEEPVTRAAAFLGLPALGTSHVVVLNTVPNDASPQEVSGLVVDQRLPFGPAALRAVAIGGAMASPSLLESAASVLRSRGRLVAPADAAVPPTITELARDATDWVGERAAVASPPVTLRSSRR